MRPLTATVLAGLVTALAVSAAPDDPKPAVKPLLKPVTPNGVRLRIPLTNTAHFKARIPRGGSKAKKGEMIDINIVFNTSSGGASTTLQTWRSWGYEAEKGGPVVLPELVVGAAQIAPKAAKGHDLEIHVPKVNVHLTEYAGDVAPKDGGWLHIGLGEITRTPNGLVEPRLHLADKFLELTLPAAAVKRLGTDTVPLGDIKVNPDATLVPSAGPAQKPDTAVFAYSSVNGLVEYKTPDGKIEPVVTSFSNHYGAPITMSFRLAHGCGVEYEEPKGEFSYLKGKAKEFRLAVQTGADLKGQKDLVLKDVDVMVSRERSHGYVILGTQFADLYMKDGVYATGPDGVWKLHGRVKPDLLLDFKTRAISKKP